MSSLRSFIYESFALNFIINKICSNFINQWFYHSSIEIIWWSKFQTSYRETDFICFLLAHQQLLIFYLYANFQKASTIFDDTELFQFNCLHLINWMKLYWNPNLSWTYLKLKWMNFQMFWLLFNYRKTLFLSHYKFKIVVFSFHNWFIYSRHQEINDLICGIIACNQCSRSMCKCSFSKILNCYCNW